MRIKLILAIILIAMSLYIILTDNDTFINQANQAAEQTIDDVKDIACEIYGLEDDLMRQEVRQEYILEELKK